jgi:hypothetical protein
MLNDILQNSKVGYMDRLLNAGSGWFVAAWGAIVSHCPSAPQFLMFLTILVTLLQAILLIIRIIRDLRVRLGSSTIRSMQDTLGRIKKKRPPLK